MPFGLRNGGNTFQCLMDQILKDLPFCFVYGDNILIFSKDLNPQVEHLQDVFLLCHEYGLTIGLPKCLFAFPNIKYLGHCLSATDCSPLVKHSATISYSKVNEQAWSPEVLRNDQLLQEIFPWCSQSTSSVHRCSQESWKSHLLVLTHGLCLRNTKELSTLTCLWSSLVFKQIHLYKFHYLWKINIMIRPKSNPPVSR